MESWKHSEMKTTLVYFRVQEKGSEITHLFYILTHFIDSFLESTFIKNKIKD
jgi:hypothetical protein